MKTHEEMKKQYKENPQPMGVFLIHNKTTHQFLLGTSLNLEGSLNKYKFVLKFGKPNDLLFKDPQMPEDYKRQGGDSFEFKILDVLKPKEEAGWNPAEELKTLEKIWLEELTGKGWKSY